MSAAKTGTPWADELLGEQLQRLGLAGAGGARDEAVPVHHRERDLDLGLLVDGAAALERGAQGHARDR